MRKLFCISIALLLILSGCSSNYDTGGVYDDAVVVVVNEVPAGFVPLTELNKMGLEAVGWESQISILQDEKCIFQTNKNNKEFIVEYQGKCYIDLEQVNAAIEKQENDSFVPTE